MDGVVASRTAANEQNRGQRRYESIHWIHVLCLHGLIVIARIHRRNGANTLGYRLRGCAAGFRHKRSAYPSPKRDTITQNDPPCQNGPSRRSRQESLSPAPCEELDDSGSQPERILDIRHACQSDEPCTEECVLVHRKTARQPVRCEANQTGQARNLRGFSSQPRRTQ